VKVGRLRHRLVLQSMQDLDVDGEVVPSWTDLAEVWGSVEAMSGREYFAAQQVNSDVTTRIVVRWRTGVEAAGRVLHQVSADSPPAYDVYDIVAPLADPVITRRWITLLCVKRASEGFRSGE
jgi:SPP1 family predicted phage head-tail adaptor